MKTYNNFNEMFTDQQYPSCNLSVFNGRKKSGSNYEIFDNEGNLIYTVFGDCVMGDLFGRSNFFSIVRVETGNPNDPFARGGYNDQRTCNAIDLAYDAIKQIFGNVDIALHIDTLSINPQITDKNIKSFVLDLAGTLDGMYNGNK